MPSSPSPLSNLCSGESKNKAALRARLRECRADLAADVPRHAALSADLQRRLLADAVWRESPVVMLYCAVRGEVDTSLLRAEAWASGKRVLFPLCRPDERGATSRLVIESALIAGFSKILAEKLIRLCDADVEAVLAAEQAKQNE